MFLINDALTGLRHKPYSRDYVFLDRDGVINVDSGYVGHWRDFRFIKGALEALSALSAHDFELVIVTNQSGIGRGLYSEQDFLNLSVQMLGFLNQRDIFVQSVHYCPHYIDSIHLKYAEDCDCRKPKPGMIVAAAAMHDIDLSRAFMVGDKLTDIRAAQAAKVGKAYLIGPAEPKDISMESQADGWFPDLLASVPKILKSRYVG